MSHVSHSPAKETETLYPLGFGEGVSESLQEVNGGSFVRNEKKKRGKPHPFRGLLLKSV